MPDSRLVKLVGAFAAVAVLSGGIAVAAAPGLHSGPENPSRTPLVNAPNVVTQTGYVPLSPCRIVDTRVAGGPISGAHTRTFGVGGTTGFLGQGGKSGGCGVPIGASSVALDVTTTQSARGNGFLAFFAEGTSRPNANQTSYLKGQNITTLVNAPVRATTGKVVVYASRTTQVLIDVAGYYQEPLAVSVNSDGTVIAKSNQVTAVTHVSLGNYEISFAENISGCAAIGTSTTSYNNVGVYTDSSTTLRVYVRDIRTSPTAYADDVFAVTVTC